MSILILRWDLYDHVELYVLYGVSVEGDSQTAIADGEKFVFMFHAG